MADINGASSAATEAFNSVKVSLADLSAKGTAHYAHKNFEEAADCYARASELQAELNGEMSPANADILFLYGRSLFKVGQSKSDVLGGKAAGKEVKKGGSKPKASKKETEEVKQEESAVIVPEQKVVAQDEEDPSNKPLFQFTGDENFEDSDDEDGEDQDGEDEEEEDDLAAAFEVLDLARVLFKKQLEDPEPGDGKGKEKGDSIMTKHIKERLADTHDLLAEISLENAKFPGAVTDFKAALVYKQELYTEESEVIAEAHFKLSLALEFASIKGSAEDGAETNGSENEAYVDQPMRDEAVRELEAALSSTKLKLQNKEVELATSHSPDDNEITRAQIAEVKDIVTEMEGRLAELKAPPIDIKDALKDALGGAENSAAGILGSVLGEKPEEAAARLEDAKKNANDLSGLVRKKKAKPTDANEPESGSINGNGKRKAEDEAADSDSSKKAKTDLSATVDEVAEN